MGLKIPQRFPDWPTRLSAYLIQVEGRKFRYGRWDCVLFMAGGVLAMTGADLAKGHRGYSGKAGASAKLAEMGAGDWPDLLKDRAISARDMTVGDLAMIKDECAGGICIGSYIKVLTPTGIGIVPRSDAVRGFKI